MKLIGLLLSVAVLAQGVPVSQDDSVFRLVASNFVDCANSDLSLCLKVRQVCDIVTISDILWRDVKMQEWTHFKLSHDDLTENKSEPIN